MWAIFFHFKKSARNKYPPNGRKFAKSGHFDKNQFEAARANKAAVDVCTNVRPLLCWN
jgi:hypothetical protein